MCKLLYLSSDEPLPCIPWNKETPAFCVNDITTTAPEIRKHLTLKHLYDIGSAEGCGCAFAILDYERWKLEYQPDEDDKEYSALVETAIVEINNLANALKLTPVVELYYCWDGDQGLEGKGVREVTIGKVEEGGFELPERVRIVVRG